jgi:hypothetical protein
VASPSRSSSKCWEPWQPQNPRGARRSRPSPTTGRGRGASWFCRRKPHGTRRSLAEQRNRRGHRSPGTRRDCAAQPRAARDRRKAGALEAGARNSLRRRARPIYLGALLGLRWAGVIHARSQRLRRRIIWSVVATNKPSTSPAHVRAPHRRTAVRDKDRAAGEGQRKCEVSLWKQMTAQSHPDTLTHTN